MKKVTFIVLLAMLTFQVKAQILNQSASWPNGAWTVTGTYNTSASAFEADPTTTANFAFDDDDAGSGSDDDIAAESPVIDLTAAHSGGETWITVTADYVYNHYSINEVLTFQYWDEDGAVWVNWGVPILVDTANPPIDDFCSGDYETYTSVDLDITPFTAAQLSNFRYRIYFNDDNGGAGYVYGFCFQSPTITSSAPPACSDPSDLTATGITTNSANLGWTESGTATQWDIEWGAPNFVLGTGTQVLGVGNPYSLGSLTPATSYEFYVRADCLGDGVSNWVGPFLFSTKPNNDECANAVTLTVNSDLACGTVTNGTLLGATDSGVNNCNGTEDDDVWYSFVATATSHEVNLSNISGSTSDLYHAVYDATPGCGALGAALTCSDPNTSTTSGLSIGNTYYVQVYSWTGTGGQNSTFDICIGTPPPPPSNDECVNAKELNILPYNDTMDASSATNNAGFISDCASGMNDGVWYMFTTDAGGTVDITVSGVTGWDPELALYSGTCGSLTCVASVDSGATGDDESLVGVAVAGATQYRINIGQWSGSTDNPEGPLTLSVSTTDTTTLGINDLLLEQNFMYYPNPVNDELNLSAKNSIEQLIIVNILGQVVKTVHPNLNNYILDFSDLNNGIYFVKATIGNTEGVFRIVKK